MFVTNATRLPIARRRAIASAANGIGSEPRYNTPSRSNKNASYGSARRSIKRLGVRTRRSPRSERCYTRVMPRVFPFEALIYDTAVVGLSTASPRLRTTLSVRRSAVDTSLEPYNIGRSIWRGRGRRDAPRTATSRRARSSAVDPRGVLVRTPLAFHAYEMSASVPRAGSWRLVRHGARGLGRRASSPTSAPWMDRSRIGCGCFERRTRNSPPSTPPWPDPVRHSRTCWTR